MILIVFAVALVASACAQAQAGQGSAGQGSAGQGSAGQGTLQGHLYGVGGPAPGGRQAWAGDVRVSGPGVKRDIHVGTDGAYSIALAPGRYTVVGHSPGFNDGKAACQAAHDAQVSSGAVTTLDVLCQMK